jgi:hypothetical protein
LVITTPAFGTGDRLYKIKTKGTRIANRACFPSFVGSAYALAGVFQQQQPVLLTDGKQLVHLGHAAAHVNRHDAFCAWSQAHS